MKPERNRTTFDDYAGDYEAQLGRGISISGESKDYFANGRIEWLRHQLSDRGIEVRQVLDYGCGTGTSIPLLLGLPQVKRVVGVDVSRESIRVAQERYKGTAVEFMTTESAPEAGAFDLVFCNGVFHHIEPSDRPGAMEYIRQSLRPGGHFALWENNPWNPGTRYVMSRIEFDRDAVPLSPPVARDLMVGHGFSVVAQQFVFFFPRLLRFLRPIERRLAGVPLGAQYLTLGRRQG